MPSGENGDVPARTPVPPPVTLGDVLVIACPGQGSQTPGMLTPWLEHPGVGDLVGQLSEATSLDLRAHGTTSDDETIKDTAIAQPLLVAAGLTCAHAIFGDGSEADRLGGANLVAGHSVGEITAAALTGVLSAQDAMTFVALRGRGMAQAAAITPTGMSAVLGGDRDEVLTAIEAAGLTPANVNAAGQIVAAGTLEQLAVLGQPPPTRSRVIPLKVAGAFHTEHMAAAVAALTTAAASLTPHDPTIPLLTNQDGRVVANGREFVNLLVEQVSNPVRWDLCMEQMADLGVTGFLELLPAGTLGGLAKRALKGVEIVTVKSPDDIDAARSLAERHS